MNTEPQDRVFVRKTLGKTVALSCPHCLVSQQVRPDAVSIFCSACRQLIDIQEALNPKKTTHHKATKTIALVCPACQNENHTQPDALSIFCKKCHQSLDVQKILHPIQAIQIKEIHTRNIHCFRCQIGLTPALKAQAVMCRKCGYRNDLQDYHVKDVLSRDIETLGTLNVSPGGTVLNSTARVQSAVIHGKFIGKLTADEVVLKPHSIFEGALHAQTLVLESQSKFTIKKEFTVHKLVIAGELHGHLSSHECIELKKGSCFTGSIRTHRIIIEEGATLVGELRVGLPEV